MFGLAVGVSTPPVPQCAAKALERVEMSSCRDLFPEQERYVK